MDSQASEAVVHRYVRTLITAWSVRQAASLEREVLHDRYRGCLLWGAVGDALGRPAEGRDPASVRAAYGSGGLREYVPWHGWRAGPAGTFTDDTQLMMAVARSVIAMGWPTRSREPGLAHGEPQPAHSGHRPRDGGRDRCARAR
jgi:ADP-ribosylglycohydrolase